MPSKIQIAAKIETLETEIRMWEGFIEADEKRGLDVRVMKAERDILKAELKGIKWALEQS